MVITDPKEKIMRARSEALVIAFVGKAASERWWDSPNRAFDGISANAMWYIDPERVYNYLMSNASGDYL
jgi:hypothetical protein